MRVPNPREGEVLSIGTLAVIKWAWPLYSTAEVDTATLTLSDGTVLLKEGRARQIAHFSLNSVSTFSMKAQSSSYLTEVAMVLFGMYHMTWREKSMKNVLALVQP
jgi:hypothetical protein